MILMHNDGKKKNMYELDKFAFSERALISSGGGASKCSEVLQSDGWRVINVQLSGLAGGSVASNWGNNLYGS